MRCRCFSELSGVSPPSSKLESNKIMLSRALFKEHSAPTVHRARCTVPFLNRSTYHANQGLKRELEDVTASPQYSAPFTLIHMSKIYL